MDEFHRKQAIYWQNASRNTEDPSAIIAYLQEARACLLEVTEKTDDDFRELAKIFSEIAIIYFNSNDFENAEIFYMNSINQLEPIQLLEDSDYLKITQLYFALADTWSHCANHTAAEEALENGIKIFNLIQIKPPELQEINVEANPELLYEHIERKTANKWYRESLPYQNNVRILTKRHHENQAEQSMLTMFGNVSIDPITNLDVMINQLNIENQQTAAPATANLSFPPIKSHQTTDIDRRFAAIEYLRLVSLYSKDNTVDMIQPSIATYQQALTALQSLKTPTAVDIESITQIQQQVERLTEGLYSGAEQTSAIMAEAAETPTLLQENAYVADSLISKMSLFNRKLNLPLDDLQEYNAHASSSINYD